ncbi:hypothetical protein [Aneurinibacillus tyrosinisolvens]|uniref:hypothetical protein n=1 Tax=Aneurinibacillus tyrosinisolvens TaxID=1443435 RepID=UPI00063F3BA7|nr:hypothetical protein [Aneurinibacillus tyrosinisolvens]
MLFGISYTEWTGYVIAILFIILLSLPNGVLKRFEKYYSNDHLHEGIPLKEGTSVFLHVGTEEKSQEGKLPSAEAEQFIAWFNEARLVQKIRFPAGQRRGILVHITTGTGEHINIVPYRNDFAVRRVAESKNTRPVEYWAKQEEISQFFDKLTAAESKVYADETTTISKWD